MIGTLSRRGQPLVALVLLLGGWVSARAMLWNPAELPQVQGPVEGSAQAPADGQAAPAAARLLPHDAPSPPGPALVYEGPMSTPGSAAPVREEPPVAPLGYAAPSPRPSLTGAVPRSPAFLPPPQPVMPAVPVALATGHQMLWMAALSRMPLPSALLGQPAGPEPFYQAGSEPLAGFIPTRSRRWSADAWVLWRRGGQALAGGLLTPSYGASQAGVVLRYRLAPDSGHRPTFYLRTTAALNGSNEREAAFGVSARPLANLPVVLAAEGRFTNNAGGNMVRPAIMAITELPPFSLPLGLRGEAYAQGGYVGGKFATPYGDGQLKIDHRLARVGPVDMRLGGGVWAGAQKGAARVDAGPSLTVGGGLGGTAAMRLGADWRFRVAGRAAPGSGPAVTLSAGF